VLGALVACDSEIFSALVFVFDNFRTCVSSVARRSRPGVTLGPPALSCKNSDSQEFSCFSFFCPSKLFSVRERPTPCLTCRVLKQVHSFPSLITAGYFCGYLAIRPVDFSFKLAGLALSQLSIGFLILRADSDVFGSCIPRPTALTSGPKLFPSSLSIAEPFVIYA